MHPITEAFREVHFLEIKMVKKLIGMAAVAVFSTSVAHADMHGNPLGTCVGEGLAAHPGEAIGVRFEIEDGKHQYEVDIKGNDARHWEIECDARTGKLLETEREVAADSPEFTSPAKVRLDAAMKTALDKFPGTIVKTEYEIENGGKVAYEFDIRRRDGKLLEVEVDAVTGKLSDPEEVLWQIGK